MTIHTLRIGTVYTALTLSGMIACGGCTTTPHALELQAAPVIANSSSSSLVRLQLSLRTTTADESHRVELCTPITAIAEGFTEGSWRQIGQSSLLRNTTVCSNVDVTEQFIKIGMTDIELASSGPSATAFSQYRVRVELSGGTVTSLPFPSLSPGR
jgi:hypothetical protein